MITRTTGWLTLFLIGTDLFVISPLLPRIAASLTISPAQAGLTVTLFALAYLAGGPTLGALADRRGHARVLAGALLLFAAANLATGFANDLAVLLAARAVAGLAASGITPSVYALISLAAPAERRATWLAAWPPTRSSPLSRPASRPSSRPPPDRSWPGTTAPCTPGSWPAPPSAGSSCTPSARPLWSWPPPSSPSWPP